jgi:isocitrate dehydrogenase
MDVTIIRENEEDTYAGIEHRQTPEVTQCLKLISRPGCERIVRYAFEFARRYGRKRVTCFTKDNIMKLTDGLFHRVFDEIGAQYPDIDRDHLIIDIGAALLADRPERFDVIIAPNLYGDIISDIAAQVAGSIGMAGSANIGTQCAMFEAVHGSAPDIAGRDLANPSGLLQAAVMLLVHVGQVEAATRIQNAWLRTLEDGIHTSDIACDATTRKVGTREFADAIVERLGKCPRHLRAAHYAAIPALEVETSAMPRPVKALVGVDVFLDWDQQDRDPQRLASLLRPLADGLALKMITNRGVKVWPEGLPETFCTDHWRCRFVPAGGTSLDHRAILRLLDRLATAGFDFIKLENLYTFDGQPGYSLGQGE